MAKVCILLPTHWSAARGGAEYQAHCLAERLLDKTDHEVVYLARWVHEDTSPFRYRITSFSGPSCFKSLKWGMAPDSVALWKSLRLINPDVIVHMVAGAYTGVAARYAQRYNRKLLWYVASDRDVSATPNVGIESPLRLIDQWMFGYGLRHATGIVCQTQGQGELLISLHGRRPIGVVPIFHPVPPAGVKPTEPITVLWVANLKPLKRPELFVQLAEELTDLANTHNVRFVMAGRLSPDRWSDNILRRGARLEHFEFVGELELDEVNDWMQRSHVFVNTSEYEGFPNTFIQAWMRQVPTLSINVDPDGVMQTASIGVACSDFATLKQTVVSLCMDDAQRIKMGERARQFAQEHFSLANADSLISLIERPL